MRRSSRQPPTPTLASPALPLLPSKSVSTSFSGSPPLLDMQQLEAESSSASASGSHHATSRLTASAAVQVNNGATPVTLSSGRPSRAQSSSINGANGNLHAARNTKSQRPLSASSNHSKDLTPVSVSTTQAGRKRSAANGHGNGTTSGASGHTRRNSNGGTGAKGKGKREKQLQAQIKEEPVEEWDEEVTRCVCGEAEHNSVVMFQCDLCKVWQHGPCVGLHNEAALGRDESYFCEACRPELHAEGTFGIKPLSPTQSATHRRDRTHSLHHHPRDTQDAMAVAALRSFLAEAGVPDEEQGGLGDFALPVISANTRRHTAASTGPGIQVSEGGNNHDPRPKSRASGRERSGSTNGREGSIVGVADVARTTGSGRKRKGQPEDESGNQSNMEREGIPGTSEQLESKVGKRRKVTPEPGSGPVSMTSQARGEEVSALLEDVGIRPDRLSGSSTPSHLHGVCNKESAIVNGVNGTAHKNKIGGPSAYRPTNKDGQHKTSSANGAPSSFGFANSAHINGNGASLNATSVAPTKKASPKKRGGGAGGDRGRGRANGDRGDRSNDRWDKGDSPSLDGGGWCLPEFLAHLSHLLPGPAPTPIEVPTSFRLIEAGEESINAETTDVDMANGTSSESCRQAAYIPNNVPAMDGDASMTTGTSIPQVAVEEINSPADDNCLVSNIKLITQLEAPTKVKFPGKRMTFPDIRKRGKHVMDYLGKIQVEQSDVTRRREVLSRAGIRPCAASLTSTSMSENSSSGGQSSKSRDQTDDHVSTVMGRRQSALNLPSVDGDKGWLDIQGVSSETLKLMDQLSRDILLFQNKF